MTILFSVLCFLGVLGLFACAIWVVYQMDKRRGF